MSEQCTEQCSPHMPDAGVEQCTEHMHGRTERTERTNEESLSPTRDNPSSFVTRTRTYGFSSDGSEPDRWHCMICDARGVGGHTALHAHYMLHHWHEVTP
jgi:hypothetical protein